MKIGDQNPKTMSKLEISKIRKPYSNNLNPYLKCK